MGQGHDDRLLRQLGCLMSSMPVDWRMRQLLSTDLVVFLQDDLIVREQLYQLLHEWVLIIKLGVDFRTLHLSLVCICFFDREG